MLPWGDRRAIYLAQRRRADHSHDRPKLLAQQLKHTRHPDGAADGQAPHRGAPDQRRAGAERHHLRDMMFARICSALTTGWPASRARLCAIASAISSSFRKSEQRETRGAYPERRARSGAADRRRIGNQVKRAKQLPPFTRISPGRTGAGIRRFDRVRIWRPGSRACGSSKYQCSSPRREWFEAIPQCEYPLEIYDA